MIIDRETFQEITSHAGEAQGHIQKTIAAILRACKASDGEIDIEQAVVELLDANSRMLVLEKLLGATLHANEEGVQKET